MTSPRGERAGSGRPAPGSSPTTGPDRSAFRFRPLTEPDARQIARWRYPAPYDFYDLPEEAWSDLLGLGEDFQAVDLAPGTSLSDGKQRATSPRRRWTDFAQRALGHARSAGPVSVVSEPSVAGFVCFGKEAQIAGARDAGLYADDALDVGIGLRPDLTGQGAGGAFFAACLDHAHRTRPSGPLRLAVATFNGRAIAVYKRAGFRAVTTCQSPVRGRSVEFLIMVRG